MIKLIDSKIAKFAEWLNLNYPIEEDVQFCVLTGYDSVGTSDGRCGVAVYRNDEDTRAIYIADPEALAKSCELSEEDKWETTYTNIAHEYCHHYQATVNGWNEEMMLSELAEIDAEARAAMIYKDYMNALGSQ